MNNDFDKLCDFNNLYQSYKAAKRGRTSKKDICGFSVNVLDNLLELQNELINETYTMGSYNSFKIYEPKERVIMALPFRDKIMQHCLCDQVLLPRLENSLILDNYASQKYKGTHKALDRLEYFMRRYYRLNGTNKGWVLKCDVSKYFYKIDHEVLKQQLFRYFKEDKIVRLLNMIIDSTDNPGIPIGNQTSQVFAIFYLNDMDHYIKEKLRIKYYLRYMDDFALIHEDKDYLKYCLEEIQRIIGEHKLTLNNKTQIIPLAQGIDMMGFHLYLTETGKVIRKLRKRSKDDMRHKLKKYHKRYLNGEMELERIQMSFNSWLGHAKHGNTHNLVRKMENLYKNLYGDKEGK